MTYTQAAALYSKRRKGSTFKRLPGRESSTRLEFDGETYWVRYHNTRVVGIHKDGSYTLNTGGWHTMTTKARIREYSPFNVYSECGVLGVFRSSSFYGELKDGMRIHTNTKPSDITAFHDKVKEARRENARRRRRVTKLLKAARMGIPANQIDTPIGRILIGE